jgi:hypothetical protein
MASLSGCATVTSSQPGFNSATGEAWYTEAQGFFGLKWGSRVYYCPAAPHGVTTCTEARMVALTKADLDAQSADDKRIHAKE